jgi:hypothetical protein
MKPLPEEAGILSLPKGYHLMPSKFGGYLLRRGGVMGGIAHFDTYGEHAIRCALAYIYSGEKK